MSRPPPPPPPYFPQPFANPGTENNSRSATRGTTQPTAGNPLVPAVHSSQVPNDGTYVPRHPAPHTSPQSSAPPPVHRNTRPPAPAPAPALTYSYSSSPPHPPSHLPLSGSVPQPLSFPVPSVPGGYGAPSNPSALVPPPSRSMTERATTTNAHNVQMMGYQNVAAPGISHQRSTTVDWSHQDDGSSSYGNQGFGQSLDTRGNVNDYATERGRPSGPSAGRGRERPSSQRTEQAPQPRLPCNLCRTLTPPDEHARLGGFCSERHKWEWDSRQNRNQSRRMP